MFVLALLMVLPYCLRPVLYLVRCCCLWHGMRWYCSEDNYFFVRLSSGEITRPYAFITSVQFCSIPISLSAENFVSTWEALGIKGSSEYILSLVTGENFLFRTSLKAKLRDMCFRIECICNSICNVCYIKIRKIGDQWCCFYAERSRMDDYCVKTVTFIIHDDLVDILYHVLGICRSSGKGHIISFYDCVGHCGVKGLRFAFNCLQSLERKSLREKKCSEIVVSGSNAKRARAYRYIKRLGYTPNGCGSSYHKFVGPMTCELWAI